MIWLTDLTANNPHQVKLSEKIHAAWDAAEAKNEQFNIMNCITDASEHGPRSDRWARNKAAVVAPRIIIMTILMTPPDHRKKREGRIKRQRTSQPRKAWAPQPLRRQKPLPPLHLMAPRSLLHPSTASAVVRPTAP